MGVKAVWEEEEGSRKRKSSLFKSKLQGGVRGEAVILHRVGKWRVKDSRGRRVLRGIINVEESHHYLIHADCLIMNG